MTGPKPRWRLHRGGIVNIWQFDERIFDFEGGRAIFQGPNGSGKSRTLELLLPLCLDGDLHHLGAKGYDSVSIRQLMLDDYSGGPIRIGYAWVELHRTTSDHGEEFITAGIGVKVSKATLGVTSSWRFVTPSRVGFDFELARPDRTPLDQKELKERIGDDAVMDDSERMQQRLASALYGIEDARRYEDLLHLLRTLRNPDVGVRAVEGQLEEYLSMALPPLDHEVIKRLAVQFQDLESIRENMRRLHKADGALAQFLVVYQQYAIRVIRERSDSVRVAQESLSKHVKAAQTRVLDIARERKARDEAADALEALQIRSLGLEAQVGELTRNTEYRDIVARQQDVDALQNAAASALREAAACRKAEDSAAMAVLSALQHVQHVAQVVRQAAARAREHFSSAGLDPALLPVPPAFPDVQIAETVDYVQVDVLPDAAPVEITRTEIPKLDLDSPSASILSSAAQSERARQAAAERRIVAINLLGAAEDLEREYEEVAALKTRAEEATAAAERAVARRYAIAEEAAAEAASWLSQVHDWLAAVLDTGALTDEPPVLPPASELVASAGGADVIRNACQDWVLPAVRRAQTAVITAESDLQTLQDEETALNEELSARRAGAELLPPLTHHSASDRSGRPGAPFYQLVDYSPSLDEEQRAGIEAALQASGLLNAWVFPGGQIADPDLQDLIATPALSSSDDAGTDTLLSVLAPVPGTDCPVTPDIVTGLLSSVRLATNPAACAPGTLVLSRTGQWRADSLTGAWSKETAEYVGPATREASRLRRITTLTSLLEELLTRLQLQQLRLKEASAQQAAWENRVKDFPGTASIAAAQSRLEAGKDAEAEAERVAADRTQEHATAEGIWQAKQAEFARRANGAGLPRTSTAITQRVAEIQVAIETVDNTLTSVLKNQYLPALCDMPGPLTAFTTAANDRRKGEAEALSRCNDYARAERALALHVEALGFNSQEFDRKLSLLKQELKGVEEEIPRVQAKHGQANRNVIKLETLQEADAPAAQEQQQALAAQESRFDSALATAGLWAAAAGDDQSAPPDRDHALQAAANWSANITDAELLNEVQTMRDSLPAGYDAKAVSYDGPLAIVISDGEGSHPVVTAAARTSRRLAEHQEQLDARYQDIFEDFLLRDLAERLREQIDAADDLCGRMNTILARAQSSQGVHVQLSWDPAPRLDTTTREALTLVRTSFTTRSPDQDAKLRSELRELIEAERDKSDAHYTEVLSRALDYRTWYAFTVRVKDTGPDGQPRNRMLRRLSSGETRVVSYVTLFAAAAAFYDTLDTIGSTPLRLVLLDEAFERVDDPTKTLLLELLSDLDIDWIITWPGGSVFSPRINRLHIYDILRPTGAPGMAFIHTTWDGVEAQRDL